MAKKEFSLEPNKGKDLYIVRLPSLVSFTFDGVISFNGILCKVIDDTTGLNEYVDDPWIEYQEVKSPGVYTAYVYLDKEHTDGIYDTFKFRVLQ